MLISKETADGVLEYLKTQSSDLKSLTSELVAEFLNYSLFEALVSLTKTASVYVVAYILYKMFDALMKSVDKEQTKVGFLAAKRLTMVLSTVFFLFASVPSLLKLGKVMIAPKIFIIENVADLIALYKK